MVDVATLRLGLIPILFVPDAETRAKEKNHAWRIHSARTKFCNLLASEHRSQLSTASYKIIKHEARKDTLAIPSKDNMDSLNPSLLNVV